MNFTETLVLNISPDEAFARAVSAARFLGWGLVESDPQTRQFRALTMAGVRSFGETVTVEIVPNPVGSEIRVCSKCRAQLVSWGKNRENAILFLRSIQEVQGSSDSTEARPMSATSAATNSFCTSCGTALQIGNRFCGKCGTSTTGIPNPAPILPRQSAVASVSYAGLSSYYEREFSMIESSGEKYQGSWNWAAFLFGGIWALTKGLWVPALIAFVGAMFTGGVIGVIYWFIFGARGNYMYYRKVTRNENPAY